MKGKQTNVSIATETSTDLAERFSVEDLLPGERTADREQLRMAHLAELAPETAYERSLANQLVEYEWEIERHRRLRNASFLADYRSLATNLLVKKEMQFRLRGEDIDEQSLLLARDLVTSDPDVRGQAETDFLELTGWESSHALAVATGRARSAFAHEEKIADLERRRRTLRKDYADLKEARASLIEDAEYVEAAE